VPLIAVDAVQLLWSLSGRRIPFAHGTAFPHVPTPPPGVWGALSAIGVGIFVAGVLRARKEST